MDGKTRLILVLLMTSVMVLIVTLLATYLNLGFRSDFVVQWIEAYFIAWPLAALTGYAVMPTARRLTDRIVYLIDGRR
jgi:MFS-type transporter involved in bile tolerance (Atg22 family)